jgi:hypothetical protein
MKKQTNKQTHFALCLNLIASCLLITAVETIISLLSILILYAFRAGVLYTDAYFHLTAQYIVLMLLRFSTANRNLLQGATIFEDTFSVCIEVLMKYPRVLNGALTTVVFV